MAEETVYVLQGGPYYKIGRSKNVPKRIKTLQTSHPYPLLIVLTWQVPNGAEVEAHLHRQFASVKMKGEWFQLPTEALDALREVKEWVIEPKRQRVPSEMKLLQPNQHVRALLERHHLSAADLTRALAKFNPPISRSYAHYVWHGVKTPSIKVILAIHQAYPNIPAAELLQVLKDSHDPA